MAAVQLDVAGLGQCALHVAAKADGHERVVEAPDEQRVGRELGQARPEAVVSVRLVEVDVARRGVEGGPSAPREVSPHELVHPGSGPSVRSGGHEASKRTLDQRARSHLQQPELGAQQAHERSPTPIAQPGERRTQQDQSLHSFAVDQAGLNGDAPAHAVAHQGGRFDFKGVERVEDGASEPGRVVGGADRLVGLAEPG